MKLGSSAGWPEQAEFEGILSSAREVNPGGFHVTPGCLIVGALNYILVEAGFFCDICPFVLVRYLPEAVPL